MRNSTTLLFILICSLLQGQYMVRTTPSDTVDVVAEVDRLREAGYRVAVVLAPGAYLCTAVPQVHDLNGVELLNTSDMARVLPGSGGHLGLSYLQALASGHFDQEEATAHMDMGSHSCEAPHAVEEERNATGVCPANVNSERLQGHVLASTFLVECNGGVDPLLYVWTPQAIEEVQLAVVDAWVIWARTAEQHGVDLVVQLEWHLPADGYTRQGYEPVLHPSTADHLWIGAIMDAMGIPGNGATAKVHAYNSARRTATGSDAAFTAFYAYNPHQSGAPSQLMDGRIGYAMLGGPYTQLLYKANGWSVLQNNRVYGHEVAHVFHAFDEYAGAGVGNCSRSFNGEPNANFHGGACAGGQACVMLDNSFTGTGNNRVWNLCTHTPVHLGWSGTIAPAQLLFPLEDTVLHTASVRFRWTPAPLPSPVSAWLEVRDTVSDVLLHCLPVSTADSIVLDLPNGAYAWSVSHGWTVPTNGHAVVRSAEGRFSVQAPLQAGFTPDRVSVCPGGTVLFQHTTTGAATDYHWFFPGGQPAEYIGPAPPPVLYEQSGAYPVVLVVSDGTLSDTLSLTEVVTVPDLLVPEVLEQWDAVAGVGAGWTLTSDDPGMGWQVDPDPLDSVRGWALRTNTFAQPGTWRSVRLRSPLIDLSTLAMPFLDLQYAYAPGGTVDTEVLMVRIVTCDGSRSAVRLERSGAGLATNGGSPWSVGPWRPAADQWRLFATDLHAFAGERVYITVEVMSRGGQNVWIDDLRVAEGTSLDLRAWLGGAHTSGATTMRSDLWASGHLPLEEPYSATGIRFVGGGGEHTGYQVLNSAGEEPVVDWVAIELRDTLAPGLVHWSGAALLRADGRIVSADGDHPVYLPVVPSHFHVAVRHRCHLGIMSAQPVDLAMPGAALDLSDTAVAVWGQGARRSVGGLAMLCEGDANRDGVVKYVGANNDRDRLLQATGGDPMLVRHQQLPQ